MIPFQFNKAFIGKRKGCLVLAASVPRLTKVNFMSLVYNKNKGSRASDGEMVSSVVNEEEKKRRLRNQTLALS